MYKMEKTVNKEMIDLILESLSGADFCSNRI